MNNKKITNKKYFVPILSTVFIISIIIGVSTFFLIYTQNLITESIFTNLGEITKQDAEKIENRIQEHERILETIANQIEEEKAQNEEDLFNIYNRNSGKDEFSRMAILYKNGETTTNDGKKVDLSEDLEYFFSSTNIQISKSRKSKVDNQEINIYSKKIKFQNDEVVILLVIDNSKFKNLFTQNIYNGNGIECIITENGEIVANSINEENNTNIFEDLKNNNPKEIEKIEKMKNEIVQNQKGQFSYLIRNHNYYISYQKLDVEDWSLIVIISGNIIAEGLNQLLQIIIIISIVIILIAVFINIYIIASNIQKKKKLYDLAYIDSITQLGNYNMYIEKITENVKENKILTIMILDIDKFKTFNKKYGHSKGNKLLKRFGEEIKRNIRQTDIVCRLANDVFGICIFEKINIENLVQRLKKNVSKIKIDNTWYNIQICIGVYTSQENEQDVQSLIDKAIIAHDSVKGNYNQTHGIFTEDFEKKIIKESEIENMMFEGIEKQEFKVYYQPQISTKNEKIEGVEALVRWNKDGKIIAPNEFIPIFEKNMFIVKLDQYMYENVCKDMQKMRMELDYIPRISVNISKESMMENNFIEKYIEIARKYDVKPSDIELEITERTTVDNSIDMTKILQELKEKGFYIAIDDFGTGYSSLNMLEALPIDTLKIDKSFIDKINKENNKLLEIIMMITKKLGLKTVAEGVEKSEQVKYVKEIGCDLIQGYYYSKPLKIEELKKYIIYNYKNNESAENTDI